MATDHTNTVILFIYKIEGRRDFWLYDGALYWRFVRAGGTYRLVRSQNYLPAGCTGYSVGVTRQDQRVLLREAARHGLQLRFFSDLDECERQAARGKHGQYIYDFHPPAGVISGDRIFFTRD